MLKYNVYKCNENIEKNSRDLQQKRKSIHLSYSVNNSNSHFYNDSLELFEPCTICPVDVSSNIANIDILIEKFNEKYETYGGLINAYQSDSLTLLYDTVDKFFTKITSGKSYDALFVEKILEAILLMFDKLYEVSLEEERKYQIELENAEIQQHNELENNKVQRQIEIENSKIQEQRNNDAECMLKERHKIIRKFVNNLISQITTDNPDHNIRRLEEFCHLIQGKCVTLCYEQFQLDLTSNEELDVLWNYIVKALIEQTKCQIQSNIETGLVIGSIIHSLLGRCPSYLSLVLNSLETRPIKSDEDSEEDYLGIIRGQARLLSSIYISQPLQGYQSHPKLGVGLLWTRLAHFANSQQLNSVEAELCNGLLEVGATQLKFFYKQQAHKLLTQIQNNIKNKSIDTISVIALAGILEDAIDQ